jgi:hypothetical protein
VRTRTIRLGDYEFVGSELLQSYSVEQFLIPRLQREYGPGHRVVQAARRLAQQHRDAELEELRALMDQVAHLRIVNDV